MPTDPITPAILPHSPEADWRELLARADRTPLYEGSGEESDLPEALATALRAVIAERNEARAAMAWVDEVYPARIVAGGAGVEITWEEFNRMERAAGFRESKRIRGEEGRAGANHKLRVKLAEAHASLARQSALIPTIQEAERAVGRREAQVLVAINQAGKERAYMRMDDEPYITAVIETLEEWRDADPTRRLVIRALSQQEPSNG